jgi:hypothetical protein
LKNLRPSDGSKPGLKLAKSIRRKGMFISSKIRRCGLVGLAIASIVSLSSARTADLNPAALAYKLPDQIKWVDDPIGSKQAIVQGDPSEPGGWAREANLTQTAPWRCPQVRSSRTLASRFTTTAQRTAMPSWKSSAKGPRRLLLPKRSEWRCSFAPAHLASRKVSREGI